MAARIGQHVAAVCRCSLCIYFSFTWTHMEFYGQFTKCLQSLMDDVEDSESPADDDASKKRRDDCVDPVPQRLISCTCTNRRAGASRTTRARPYSKGATQRHVTLEPSLTEVHSITTSLLLSLSK